MGDVQEQLTHRQVANVVGISHPNVDKWIANRGLAAVAYAAHPVGKLYDRQEVEVARDKWLVERDREADEKRRAAANRNAAA